MAPKQRLRLRHYLISILGGALGVQSESTRQRDFTHGNPALFIAGGIAFTLLFVLILVFIVRTVVAAA